MKSSSYRAFPPSFGGGDRQSAAGIACVGGLVASSVAATALALAAVTEARHESPSLAEAREATLAGRRETSLRRGTSSPDEPTRGVGIPAAQTEQPLTDG